MTTLRDIRALSKEMSTSKWMELPVVLVSLRDLVYLQPLHAGVGPGEQHTSYSGDAAIHILEHSGILYVEDGHNRCARAVRVGDIVIEAHILHREGALKRLLRHVLRPRLRYLLPGTTYHPGGHHLDPIPNPREIINPVLTVGNGEMEEVMAREGKPLV